jgi:uncharacterized membrane protein YgcG
MNKIKLSVLFFFFAFSLTIAQERILDFDVSIEIEKTGVLKVTENITIRAEGNNFKHGLLRTLPLFRKDIHGNEIDVEYHIDAIKKDGNVEDYFTKEEDGFWKIYIGDKDYALTPNVYKYQISYHTPFQIGFFDTYDELYWNVTGNGWDFLIEKASCHLYMPSEKDLFQNVHCYTGQMGSKASNCHYIWDTDKRILTFSAEGLSPNEGLTIAASFPKGIVTPPSDFDKFTSSYKQIKSILWSALFGLGMFLFFFFDWKKYGKDPSKKSVIPEFRPPFNWSPAIVGYVYKKECTDKMYMASMINCAIKGALKINSIIKKNVFSNTTTYELEIKKENAALLSSEEEALFKPLSKRQKINLVNTHYEHFSDAYSGWYDSVSSQINIGHYYQGNWGRKWIVFLISIATGLAYIIASTKKASVSYPMYILAIAILLGFAYWFKYKIESTGWFFLRFILFFFLGFLSIGLFFFSFAFLVPIQFVVIGIVAIMYIVYCYTIGAYTQDGAEAVNRIEGFKRYLETAEADRINILNAPEKTPELFEQLLPYAIALDVDVLWGENFKNILEAAKYNPDWVDDNEFYRKPTLFINRFNESVSDSRVDPTPPSSSSSSSGSSGSWSSGSSGGGSSGGGGGGGGGGGW